MTKDSNFLEALVCTKECVVQLGTAHFPTGVSLVGLLQCLATLSEALGAHHIAAAAHSTLQQYYQTEGQQVCIQFAALVSSFFELSVH